MKLFKSTSSIFEEISDMERDEAPRREDRATVSAFFNGKPPFSQAEADSLGLTCNVNNLFGYTDLAASKEATLALYTKPARLWSIELDSAPVGKKQEWEQDVTDELNKIVKKHGRLRMPYEGVAGDATLHGEGEFYFPDCRCPLPRHLPLSQRLIPNNASADPGELTHFAISTDIPLHDLMFHIRRESEGWNLSALRALSKDLFDTEKKANGSKWSAGALTAVDSMNAEELEYARQTQGDIDRVFRTKVPVYYFFQADPDRDGRPLDLTIVPRINRKTEEGSKLKEESLFDAEEYYPSIQDALQPFFMDCILGGEPKWHRVKGLGHINYSVAWHIEVLMDRLMQGSMEAAQTFWKAGDASTREDLEKILLRHNGIIPEGVSLMPERTPTDLNGIMAVLGLFRQQAAKNARSAFSNDETGRGQGNELQVQAMFRQNAITAQQSSRLSNWYDAKSRLGATILARYTNCDISTKDKYYSEIMEFQSALKRRGIPLWYVQPHNVNVTSTKITGDGDDMKARQTALFTIQNLQQLPPESQQLAKRDAWGILLGDYEKAEAWVPIGKDAPEDQVRDAEGENNTCILQGRPPKPRAKDVDEVHADTHLQGLVSIVQMASARGEEAFNPQELLGFKALGAHTVMHVQRMGSMGKKDIEARYMEALNQVSKMAEKLRHNMEQKQQAQQQEPIDPLKVADLQLKKTALELKAKKDEFAAQKFERTQSLREHDTAIKQSTHLAADARAEAEHKAGLAETDTRLALDVAAHAREAAQPEPVA